MAFDVVNNTVPTRVPEPVTGYTENGQITPEFVSKRDALFGVNTTRIREEKKGIVTQEVIERADSCVSSLFDLSGFWE